MVDNLATPTPLELRSEFVDMIYKDLHGPAGGENEIVTETSVRSRYILGMLAPNNHSPIPDPADEIGEITADGGDTTDDGVAEPDIPDVGETVTFMPSSMGITFSTDLDVDAIRIRVRWGRYKRVIDEERRYWQREQKDFTTDLSLNNDLYWAPDPENKSVYIRGIARQRNNGCSITLFLVNGMNEPKERKDEAWLFQPEIIVTSPDEQPIFIKRQLPPDMIQHDPEDRAMQMMYRRTVEFAVGHGVGVHVELPDGEWERANTVMTRVVPEYEVERMDPPTIEGLIIDMKNLSELNMGDFGDALLPLVDSYEAWLREHADMLDNPPDDLSSFVNDAHGTAHVAVENGVEALDRIREGIALLDAHELAFQAFQFANRAMYLQRIRSIYAEQIRQGKQADMNAIDIPANRSWRPFQLAFILLNLPEMVDPTHERRSHPTQAYADLLWFPTGGGKTEAYLGLAAFTMGIRRLQGDVAGLSGHAGVTVLMRYTLRLLTLQQFQRATTLIAACEIIRRDNPKTWGMEPFRIGLWVGQSSTPNWTSQSAEAIKQEHGQWGGKVGSTGTPVQLTNCPWCGTPIEPGKGHIQVELYENGRGRTFIYCGDKLGRCPFSQKQSPDEGLPVVVVDEEIYRRLPSLVIATVDKFAQMPWKGETQMLFGRVNGYCPRHGYRSPEIDDADRHPKKGKFPACTTQEIGYLRPPDLIIQDELHLISGPLGTLVGLYETAVDNLASWEVDGILIRPKVVASTATIRRANQQVHSLFLRSVRIFPPSGFDAENNFFSRQTPTSDSAPGRLYLGVCASGTRQKAVLIRAYVAAMAAAQTLFDKYGAIADPYMTLIGYFNSMRDLGGMRRVIDDAVQTRLIRMTERGLSRRYIGPTSVDELTSRKSAIEIPRILDRLETTFSSNGNERDRQRPLDTVLATNMISVGVDISRLGIMIVAGQPKATAEYIQATSRVGRRHPGVVFTVYNWSRPRDISHYERFEHYHATFYQQVEALSVTPFAPRALDRGLSGVLVALIRLLTEKYNANEKPNEFVSDDELAQLAIQQIAERAAAVSQSHQVENMVIDMLKSRLDHWVKATRLPSSKLTYQKSRKSDISIPLLKHTDESNWTTYTILNSLRDVEPGIRLILDDYRMDSEQSPKEDVE